MSPISKANATKNTYDTDARTKGPWWQVGSEFRLYNSRIPVWTCYTTEGSKVNARSFTMQTNIPPNNANLRSLNLPFGLIYESHSLMIEGVIEFINQKKTFNDKTYLAEVELGIVLRRYSLNLEQRSIRPRIALRPLVAKDTAFGIQSAEQA